MRFCVVLDSFRPSVATQVLPVCLRQGRSAGETGREITGYFGGEGSGVHVGTDLV